MKALIFLLCTLLIIALIFCSVIRVSNNVPPLRVVELISFFENLEFPSYLLSNYLYHMQELADDVNKAWADIQNVLGIGGTVADMEFDLLPEHIPSIWEQISNFLTNLSTIITLPYRIVKDFIIYLVHDLVSILSWFASFASNFLWLFGFSLS